MEKQIKTTYTFQGHDDKSYDARATLTIDENGDYDLNSDYFDPKKEGWTDTEEEWTEDDINATFEIELSDEVSKFVEENK